MISFLAKLFRGLSWIMGATPPPPGKNEGTYVLTWVGVIAFTILFCAVVLYSVLHVFG